ncbi:SpoIIE family protein phosphatase [Streptomyces sp. NPDC059015]|uniref:SpoIIE family protein phosphatase n=1 Tax=unclassified Streptomyces TaxID=2593676 RepID=UPI0036A2C960
MRGAPPPWSGLSSAELRTGRAAGPLAAGTAPGRRAALLPGGRAGPLLGRIPGCAHRTATVPLEPDDLLLLCTGGLIAGRDEDVGESLDGLVRGLAREGPLSPQETVGDLVSAHTAAGLEDDVRLPVLRIG